MEWFFNGPNFFGSKAELKEILKGVDKEKINKLAANQGTILHPPLGQHLQGLFKNMVKSFKASSQWNSQICRHGRWGTSHSFYRCWKLIEFLTAKCQGTDIKGNTSHTTDHFLFGQMAPRNYFSDVNGAKKYKIWKKVTLYFRTDGYIKVINSL